MDFDAELKELNRKLDSCYMDHPVSEFPWARAANLQLEISQVKHKQALAALGEGGGHA